MITVVRGLLYCVSVLLMAGGVAAFCFPHLVTEAFHLSPLTVIGTAEIRGLYGGGFFSFGLITLFGLRSLAHGSGLLLAMAVFMGTVAAARAISIPIDQEFAFTVPSLIAEVVMGAAYWIAGKAAQ